MSVTAVESSPQDRLREIGQEKVELAPQIKLLALEINRIFAQGQAVPVEAPDLVSRTHVAEIGKSGSLSECQSSMDNLKASINQLSEVILSTSEDKDSAIKLLNQFKNLLIKERRLRIEERDILDGLLKDQRQEVSKLTKLLNEKPPAKDDFKRELSNVAGQFQVALGELEPRIAYLTEQLQAAQEENSQLRATLENEKPPAKDDFKRELSNVAGQFQVALGELEPRMAYLAEQLQAAQEENLQLRATLEAERVQNKDYRDLAMLIQRISRANFPGQ